MNTNLALHNGSVDDYFNRLPEKLVLEGYRHWWAGYETGSIEPWELVWNLYAVALGTCDARRALPVLSNYVRTLKRCAACPLRSFPFHSRHLCTEECLTMGLVAGLQHGDEAAELCLRELACPIRCNEVEDAANDLAQTLTELQQVMLPIPATVIEDVLRRARPATVH